jgi:hypothetical protein
MAVLGNRVIKSIQRGSTAGSVNSTTAVTISSVDTSKAFVSASFKNGYGAGGAGGGTADNAVGVSVSGGAALTGSTTITIYFGVAYSTSNNSGGTVYWEVIEYE